MTAALHPCAPSPPVGSQLVRKLLRGDFALTAEVVPPLSSNPNDLNDLIAPLKADVDALNIADSAGGKVRLSGLACAALMTGNDIEPVLQMTCRDRNKIALLSELIGAGALGVHNLLILRGDKLNKQQQPDITEVHDVTPTELIEIAANLTNAGFVPGAETKLTNRSITLAQSAVSSPPQFFVGAADVPADCNEDYWAGALKAKIEAGAQFIQTQLCYDLGQITNYATRLNDNDLSDRVFVLIGTGPLKSAQSALWMRENLWGVDIPDAIISRLDTAGDPVQEGIKICAEILDHIADTSGLAGAHLMAPGNNDAIPQAISQAGVASRRSQIT